MVERRHMRRVSPILLVTLSLGCFFATYNLIVMVRHNRASIPRKVVPGGLDWLDPVTGMPEDMESTVVKNVKYHVALTATDAPYSKWQCRVMYYWYKKVKDMPGSDMGGFTRVLHSGKPDNLMDEIPIIIVDPLPEGLDRGYIVLNRPWAFVQWLEKATIEEEYILMAEPDHIFVKPLPNLAYGDHPVAFPFFYIKPSENEKIIRKYYPAEKGPVTDIDPIGNSPVIIKKSVLEKIAPTWMNVSMRMKDDAETDKAFGWVLEMYGYAVASALHGVRHSLRKDFMIQPPWDTEVGKSFIIHYTYGCDYDKDVVWIKKCVGTASARVVTNLGKDTFTPSVCRIAGQFHSLIAGQFQSGDGKLTYGKIGEWRFDKRTYLTGPPPRNLTLPPPGVPESVVELVKKVNEATANIPGWDSS